MQFLYRITPRRIEMVTEGPSKDEEMILSRHFDYLNTLTKHGTMLLFGRTQNADTTTFGIAIFRAESEDEARAIMNEDPAVKEKIMRAELYPYKVAGLNTRGWE